MILPPDNPIAAVTHPDPYPYYANLLASQPFYRDETVGLWIASSAATVTAVLTSDLCRVRPQTEQVPRVLLDSSAADIFRHLVRMKDGQGHDSLKTAVSRTLQTIDADQLARQSTLQARELVEEMLPQTHLAHLTDFTFQLPVYVVASLLGIPRKDLPQTTRWINDFARCLAPISTPEQIKQGKNAAGHLLNLMYAIPEPTAASSLLKTLAREAKEVEYVDREVIAANSIGLLFQTYEATAGLIGNTLLALARHQHLPAQVLDNTDLLHPVIQEVLRYDPPIQNTRRFLAGSGIIAGKEMKEGDIVLVVLAAANRDPALNANPERFDISRKDRRLFTFGTGSHACPGENIAAIIARAGVEQLLISGINLSHLTEKVSYRPSGNARIPLFDGGEQ